ncbi:50S ribosomal protein L10 [Candidatus Phytoplasma rubi]|uniref:Large ribosomal subunit protein uL10 n=1 Tax=Candidatus Phytoplasma rubi TaxID=399025 RepID=A0ABY7BSG1_9MOLU|nr:50S ribosomal protein L10 [Candidatus Phytoplasma rubi]WAN63572.1 50S ribosomal protein L10 [Candidatus Phytoplasma rubi]
MTNLAIIEQKKADVDLLIQNIKKSEIIILFEYQGIKVSDLTELRVELQKQNSMIKVYSNNILKRAFKSTDYNELVDLSKYSKVLLLSSGDSIEPIKILFNFVQKNKFLKIVKGIIDNKVYSCNVINEIAVLPSKEYVLAMLSSGMMFALRELIISLNILSNK